MSTQADSLKSIMYALGANAVIAVAKLNLKNCAPIINGTYKLISQYCMISPHFSSAFYYGATMSHVYCIAFKKCA